MTANRRRVQVFGNRIEEANGRDIDSWNKRAENMILGIERGTAVRGAVLGIVRGRLGVDTVGIAGVPQTRAGRRAERHIVET
jgi:hypothetical protein